MGGLFDCIMLCADNSKGMTVKMIGRTARYLTMRVKSDGRVSSDPQKNVFIRVSPSADTGDIVSIAALQKVYGSGLCPAALCSKFKSGSWRMQCCDRANNARHKTLSEKAHALPVSSGPSDTKNWARVQKLTAEHIEKIKTAKRRKIK